jgi:hypothetical protein
MVITQSVPIEASNIKRTRHWDDLILLFLFLTPKAGILETIPVPPLTYQSYLFTNAPTNFRYRLKVIKRMSRHQAHPNPLSSRRHCRGDDTIGKNPFIK